MIVCLNFLCDFPSYHESVKECKEHSEWSSAWKKRAGWRVSAWIVSEIKTGQGLGRIAVEEESRHKQLPGKAADKDDKTWVL